MYKKLTLIFFLIFMIFLIPNSSIAQENHEDLDLIDRFLREQLNNLNIEELELVLEDIFRGGDIDYPKIKIKDAIISTINGKKILSFNEILSVIFNLFLLEIRDNLILIIQIFAITIAFALLTNLASSFQRENVTQLAQYACYTILTMLSINSFVLALELGKKTVIQMVDFMQIILPILLSLLTIVSGPNTRLLFHPIILGSMGIIASIVKNLIFPLILFSFIIGIIGNISEKVPFFQLSELMRQIIVGVVAGALTIFIGVITIFGIGSKVDGITIRTAKFAVDNLVPIVGKFLSDAVETVVSCSAILKNGIGLIGLIILFLICVIPIIKIVTLILSYKIIAAIAQPIASENIINFFNEVGKGLLLIMIGVLSVGTMFFITIAIVVELGNATIMLR
ncbi:MAG: stage III sporulation protein AE [Tissierellia bacterium]|nr:stage III sporulation protein AE [Tissierellia bacterium]